MQPHLPNGWIEGFTVWKDDSVGAGDRTQLNIEWDLQSIEKVRRDVFLTKPGDVETVVDYKVIESTPDRMWLPYVLQLMTLFF
jgi:hypothetical protein